MQSPLVAAVSQAALQPLLTPLQAPLTMGTCPAVSRAAKESTFRRSEHLVCNLESPQGYLDPAKL